MWQGKAGPRSQNLEGGQALETGAHVSREGRIRESHSVILLTNGYAQAWGSMPTCWLGKELTISLSTILYSRSMGRGREQQNQVTVSGQGVEQKSSALLRVGHIRVGH